MSIFNFVMGEVDEVVSKVLSENDRIQQLMDSLQNAMDPLQNGLWTGQGANAFYEECLTRLFPEIAALIASIAGFQLNIGQAQDRVLQGDDEAYSCVNNLVGVYEQINI